MGGPAASMTTSGSCSPARPGPPPGAGHPARDGHNGGLVLAGLGGSLDHRVPAQPVPDLLPADHTRDAGPPGRPACSTPGWPTSPAPSPPPPVAAACSPCSPTASPSWPHPAKQLDDPGHPARSLAASAASPRCAPGSLTAAAFSPGGAPMLAGDLRPPRDHGHLRLRQRNLARLPGPRCQPPTHTRTSLCSA